VAHFGRRVAVFYSRKRRVKGKHKKFSHQISDEHANSCLIFLFIGIFFHQDSEIWEPLCFGFLIVIQLCMQYLAYEHRKSTALTVYDDDPSEFIRLQILANSSLELFRGSRDRVSAIGF